MQITKYFVDAKKLVENILFPVQCFGCGQEGNWLCSTCRSKIDVYQPDICPCCHQPSDNYSFCKKCSGSFSYNRVLIFGKYENQCLKSLIQAFKYNCNREMVVVLEDLLRTVLFQKELARNQNDLQLIPVPLHPKKLRLREFNQSYLLSEIVSEINDIPILDILKRETNTRPQAGLSREQRLNNVKDSIVLEEQKRDYSNKTFILVDDVFTTGSTLEACALKIKILKPKDIWALVVAHG